MKKFLWIGDAVVQTGFSRVTHNVVPVLKELGWDVHVLGINYNGDPHKHPYNIYPAMLGGDVWGVGRVKALARAIKPDIIVILNDPWNVTPYLEELPKDVPVIGYMPVDAPNQIAGTRLNDITRAITYTNFGRKELLLGGYRGRCDVIPHGVDTSVYYPVLKAEARKELQLDHKLPPDSFIVTNVNRNQPRKRLDLTLQYWAQWWINAGQPKNAYLHIHAANRDIGWNLLQLSRYFGIEKQLIFTNPNMTQTNSLPEAAMRLVYSAADVQLSTTTGEGWGLTTHEGMACGVPQIFPDYSALGEWAGDVCTMVPVTSYQVHPNGINSVGGIPDMQGTVDAIDKFYKMTPEERLLEGIAGFNRAIEPRFQWPAIGKQFDDIFSDTLNELRRTGPVGVVKKQEAR